MANTKKTNHPNKSSKQDDTFNNETELPPDLNEPVSKSELKRQMHQLQTLGEALTQLKEDVLKQLPISEKLFDAIGTTHSIKKHEAKRRHMQFIGKLMRKEDEETIKQINAIIHDENKLHRKRNDHHHLIEQWRDDILRDGATAIERFISDYPHAERQWLQQIVRQHNHEQAQNKSPAASRKLFDYIRQFVLM